MRFIAMVDEKCSYLSNERKHNQDVSFIHFFAAKFSVLLFFTHFFRAWTSFPWADTFLFSKYGIFLVLFSFTVSFVRLDNVPSFVHFYAFNIIHFNLILSTFVWCDMYLLCISLYEVMADVKSIPMANVGHVMDSQFYFGKLQ